MKLKPTNQQVPILQQHMLKINNQIIWKPPTYPIFSNGIFSDLLKTLNVISVLKRGENQDYNNYRPISLISKPKQTNGKDCTPKTLKLPSEKLFTF